MRRRTLAAIVMLAVQLPAAIVAGGRASCRFANITTRGYMERAVEGAMKRLQDPDCQQIFRDFSDPAGVPLAEVLERLRLTPIEFMATLHFVEGNETPQCLKNGDLAAFTAPGHRVIFVCGSRLLPVIGGPSRMTEMIVIHEVLHAIGLAENPPASREITARVTRRCA